MMIENENKTGDDLLTCPSCGEKSPKRRKRCPNCGAVLRPEQAAEPAPAPTRDEEPVAPISETTATPEPTAAEQPSAAAQSNEPDDVSYARAYGGTPFDSRSDDTEKKSDGSYESAYGGTPFDQRSSGAFVTTRPSTFEQKQEEPKEVDAAAKKKRKISFIAYCASAGLALIGLIFALTPFLSVKVGSSSFSQNGFGALGVIFGGTSMLGIFGASVSSIMLAGAAYIAFLLLTVLHCVCVGLSYKLIKNGEKAMPLGNTAIGLLIFGVIALGVALDAAGDIGSHSSVDSMYMGGVAVGVFGALCCAATGFGYFYSKNTYPRTKVKLKGLNKIVSVLCAVIVIACFALEILPMLDLTVSRKSEREVGLNESGRATIICDRRIGSDYGGVIVFKLEDLEENGEYSFRIKFDDKVGTDILLGSVWLSYYDDVGHASMDDILDAPMLEENTAATDDSATLTFTNKYGGKDLAVVTGFTINGLTNIYLDYAFFDSSIVRGVDR